MWKNANADLLNGTDGTLYPPFRTRDQVLYSFSSDMCRLDFVILMCFIGCSFFKLNRSYNLVYLKDNRVEGIETLDFHLPPDTFYNSSLNPLNEGFTKSDNYLGNGVQNISVCYGSIIWSLFSSIKIIHNFKKIYSNKRLVWIYFAAAFLECRAQVC